MTRIKPLIKSLDFRVKSKDSLVKNTLGHEQSILKSCVLDGDGGTICTGYCDACNRG